MLDMTVFIVSRSRWRESSTLRSLGRCASLVKLVVPTEQADKYSLLSQIYNCEVVPCDRQGIALTRQFCGEVSPTNKFILLDDDLTILYRKSDSIRLYQPTMSEQSTVAESMLREVSNMLDRYALVAVSLRQGNHLLPYEGAEFGRHCFVTAYQRDKFLECRHGRVKVMEDFDIALQLLRRGYKNYVIAKYAIRQHSSNAPGGCSDYRTLRVQREAAKTLSLLHPNYVTVSERNYKEGGKGFGSRYDVTVRWYEAWSDNQPHLTRGKIKLLG